MRSFLSKATRLPGLVVAVLLATVLSATALISVGLASAGATPAQAVVPTQDQWSADVDTVMAGSQQWLDERVAQGGGTLALNLDIDNSSLSTYYARNQPIQPVLDLALHAQAAGVRVVFNTGRHRPGVRRAVGILQQAGYPVDGICGRRHRESLRHSKQRCRRHFVAEGLTIIGNVGNNRTDFVGRNYERAFRLPNYGGLLS